jgi:sugar lactone lactonase YvrE
VRRAALVPLALLAAAVVCLLAGTTPALALNAHVFKSSFGSAGSGAGQFAEPSGVAVNEVTLGKVGDVYVADKGNNRVEWFSPEGKGLKGEFDGSETPAKSVASPTAIAIDNSTNPLDPSAGDVYVVDSGNKVIDKFEAGGKYVGSITTGSGGEPLGELDGVAVDTEGLVWVYQGSGEIDSYSSTVANEFLSSRSSPFGASPGFAVDSEDHLYVNRGAEVIAKINSSGETMIEEIDAEGSSGAAVDTATGEAFVDNVTSVAVFDSAAACTAASPCTSAPSGSLLDRFGSGHLEHSNGVAVDASSDVAYVADSTADAVRVFTPTLVPDVATGPPSNPGEGAVTLNGTVNPDGVQVTSCEFEYGLTTTYGSTAECSANPGAGSSPVAVSADLSGLQLGNVYHYRLVAGNKNGANASADSTIQVGPLVEAESISGVGTVEATVAAHVNAGGRPTTYRVEYGTTSAYGSSTPAESVGAPAEAVAVSVRLEKLEPGVEYHYRFVATNEFGSTFGSDVPFTTFQAGGAAALTLPDERVFELVSSPNSNQNVYGPSETFGETNPQEDFNTERAVRAAADGGAIAYLGDPPAGAEGEGGGGLLGNGLGNAWLGTRTPDGWSTKTIQPPLATASGFGNFTQYEAFSSDLTAGIVASGEALTHDVAPACTLYLRTASDGSLHPLVTAAQTLGRCRNEHEARVFAGGSTDASHLLFENEGALTPGSVKAAEGQFNLYDSTAGQPHLVNVLPNGKTDPNATFGSPAPSQNFNQPDFSNVASADGSRIFWTDLNTGNLYVRENDTQPQSPLGAKGECTVPADACALQVDATQGPGPSGGGRFLSASADGTRVFFTDCSKLTQDSTAVEGSCLHETEGFPIFTGNDLYEYNVNTGKLADLTVDANAGDPLRADVQGVIGTSEDGAYVYSVAGGALAPGATPRTCKAARLEEPRTEEDAQEQAEEEQGLLPAKRGCNLYLLHAGEPARFIAALSPTDNALAGPLYESFYVGDWHADLGSRVAEVTPDGRSLVFRSALRLTGYNSSVGQAKVAVPEVFVYDATRPGAPGNPACVSCNPTGAPPIENAGSSTGAFLPPSLHGTYMPRWISEDGRHVFFDTFQPLVPQDTNGRQDVYEWEREGAPGCPERTSASLNGGCVFLLSGGSSSDNAFLLDASADGSDVFFTSRASLVPEAVNENVKLYDARVRGGFSRSSLACSGTGCQGVPPAPPIFATPSSATFNGVGNFPPPPSTKAKTPAQIKAGQLVAALKACRSKKNKHKRALCEAQAKKRYGPPHKAKKPSKGRKGVYCMNRGSSCSLSRERWAEPSE